MWEQQLCSSVIDQYQTVLGHNEQPRCNEYVFTQLLVGSFQFDIYLHLVAADVVVLVMFSTCDYRLIVLFLLICIT